MVNGVFNVVVYEVFKGIVLVVQDGEEAKPLSNACSLRAFLNRALRF